MGASSIHLTEKKKTAEIKSARPRRADILCGMKSGEGVTVGLLKFGLFINGAASGQAFRRLLRFQSSSRFQRTFRPRTLPLGAAIKLIKTYEK